MKFCNKCGNSIEENINYCCNCGNYIGNNQNQVSNNQNSVQSNGTLNNSFNNNQTLSSNLYNNQKSNIKNNPNIKQPNSNIKNMIIGIILGLVILLIIGVCFIVLGKFRGNYYFNIEEDKNENSEVSQPTNSSDINKKNKYSTVIVYDNVYSGVNISTDKDAFELIVKDSVDQKNNCPKEIKNVEDDLISKYGITAVNLCEMDVGFAKELGNVFKKIYNEYPMARGYITNLTLVNASLSNNYIAAFAPAFQFATADTSSTYPWTMKTQILLNTSYFLNQDRLKTSVASGSKEGHFPPNATMYSPVAHELGHYLSFLAMMKNYKMDSILLLDNNNVNTFYQIYSDFAEGNFSLSMIKEAYDKYKKDTNTGLTLDEWRGTISKYALAKDNEGKYIYDETIAEAFHDVYLNENNAKDASKYIVNVLKDKLEK